MYLKIFTLLLFLVLNADSNAENNVTYHSDQASLVFNSWIRVEVSAKVIEAVDSSVINEPAPFIQSLSYTGKKDLTFKSSFGSETELRDKILNTLCKDLHDVDLDPLREAGAKGLRKFRMKLSPAYISIKGTIHSAQNIKSFESTVFCKK